MKIYIETLGCAKNAADSEMAGGILQAAGHELVNGPQDAEAILVNTCGFINDAKKESIHKILELAEWKDEGRLLLVSGCLAQRYGDELYKEMPEVDIFLGVNDYPALPEILKHHVRGQREKHLHVYEKGFLASATRNIGKTSYSATLKIAEGCDNVCTYCVIPSIRGSYRSKKMEDVLREAEALAEGGCRELILIAQDLTAYGMDLYGELKLAELVRALCRIDTLRWIRLMYCYEDRITDELIQVMAEEKKVCHYIDLPIQHANDRVLSDMNRRSTKASILDTIQRLRTAMPDIHIRTTLIVGFPGETDEAFAELAEFVEEMRFERLGVFAYSKEEGTLAAGMAGQVAEEVKEQRKEALMMSQLDISLAGNQQKVGRVLEVLVEEQEEEGSYIGRTGYDAPEIDHTVIFTSQEPCLPGEMVMVRIIDAFDYDLVGEREAIDESAQ